MWNELGQGVLDIPEFGDANISRRKMLWLVGTLAASPLLVACGQTPKVEIESPEDKEHVGSLVTVIGQSSNLNDRIIHGFTTSLRDNQTVWHPTPPANMLGGGKFVIERISAGTPNTQPGTPITIYIGLVASSTERLIQTYLVKAPTENYPGIPQSDVKDVNFITSRTVIRE